MKLTETTYVPALRWRQGEYQALFHLFQGAKEHVVPYISIPEVEYDFAEMRPKRTVQEHIHPFAKRYKAKWGMRPAWIGVSPTISDQLMGDGRDVFTYIFDSIKSDGAMAVPAISINDSAKVIQAVRQIQRADLRGVALSIRLEDLMKGDVNERISALTTQLAVASDSCDLFVDLGAPNFEPYDLFATGLGHAIGKLKELDSFRNFVLIASAVPTIFAKGEEQVSRHDWLYYLALRSRIKGSIRLPNYGDYTIVHPEFKALDMRKVKSAGKLVYATSTAWEVRKGGAFRDNPAQMHDHCQSIVASGKFRGPAFSAGDDFIAKCAVRTTGPSNQSRWKGVAVNHHMTQVLDDLAKLSAAT